MLSNAPPLPPNLSSPLPYFLLLLTSCLAPRQTHVRFTTCINCDSVPNLQIDLETPAIIFNQVMALRFAEGYVKPRELKYASGTARKRASIRALGSITYLQRYYASGGTICEGLARQDSHDVKASFLDSISLNPRLASPNAEELLRICHEDIQVVLDVWGIISYPSLAAHATDGQEQALDSPISVNGDDPMRQLSHIKDLSSSSLSSQQQQQHYDNVSVDLLALLESSTKAISSIRNYSMHAPILSNEALTIHRQAALSVIEMLSLLELGNRLNDTEGQGINQPDGYCYARLQFGDLEEERAEMKKYLMVVQDQLFKPQAEQIETKLERLLTKQQTMAAINHSSPTPTICTGQNRLPDWINDHAWQPDADGNVSLERCHAFLEFFRPETRRPIPSPTNDLEGFIQALRDGYVMCMVFNSFISLTNMPFGIVDKIHEDTKRTWRGADNWRFLIQACRFRLEFKIVDGSFKPIDIVRQTDLGRHQLQTWLRLIVQRGIEEAQETLESKKTLPLAPPSPIFMDF